MARPRPAEREGHPKMSLSTQGHRSGFRESPVWSLNQISYPRKGGPPPEKSPHKITAGFQALRSISSCVWLGSIPELLHWPFKFCSLASFYHTQTKKYYFQQTLTPCLTCGWDCTQGTGETPKHENALAFGQGISLQVEWASTF